MKTRQVLLLLAAVGLWLSGGHAEVPSWSGGHAHALVDTCDPSSFKDLVIQSTDLRTNIIYAETLKHKQSGSSNSTVGVDILGYVGLSDDEKQQYLDDLSKLVDLNISSDDKKFLLVSEMSLRR